MASGGPAGGWLAHLQSQELTTPPLWPSPVHQAHRDLSHKGGAAPGSWGPPVWEVPVGPYPAWLPAVVKAVDPAEVVLVRDEPSSGHSQPRTPKHAQGVCGPWALLGQLSQEVPARGTHPQPPPRTLLARGP